MRTVLNILLAAALAGCSQAQASPGSDVPRRVADYSSQDSNSPVPDPCALPLSQRTTGWLCAGPR
jgi:hypothetical protein